MIVLTRLRVPRPVAAPVFVRHGMGRPPILLSVLTFVLAGSVAMQASAGAAAVKATAVFVKADTTTQGNWRSNYGSEGYNISGDLSSNPAYAAPALSGQSSFVWSPSSTDVRALQKASGSGQRVAGQWFTYSSMFINTNISDTAQHQVAIYCLDWDATIRRQTVSVLDADNNVLSSQSLTRSFHNGVYLVWNVTGNVKVRITTLLNDYSDNASISGFFFGGSTTQKPVSISLSPGTSNLAAGQTQQFTASVSGSVNTAVLWSMNPPSGMGTITTSGLFTAPASISALQNVTVTATSGADATRSATATVSVHPVVKVTVSPSAESMTSGQTQQFSASVTGAASAGVTWSLNPASGAGTITAQGLYTAPGSVTAQQAVGITATSAADTTSSSTASVTLTPAPASTVRLPIEVMGPNGATQSVQVTVPGQATLSSNRLQVRIHGLDYENKASVQVNNSGWMPINTQTATLSGMARNFGGIGGGFATIQLTLNLPAGSLTYGVNTIQFQFVTTNGVSSGFRVVSFNLLNPDGSPMLPQSAFTNDDPNTWQPPSTLPSDIAAGKTLWQTAALTSPGASSSISINAHCSDCHTQDGRDLKYFNYSNYAIRQRAIFHGLSGPQGDQIASYIRSLNVPNPGRPWNPPYQPGPGLDSQPVTQWAAGAGLDAVLDSDSAMLPYVSPNLSATDFNPAGNLNIRETPVAFQLLDWNRWLPRVHPVDVWGGAFTQSNLFTTYKQLRAGLAPGDTRAYSNQQYSFDNWSQYKDDFKASVPAPDFSSSAGATQMYSLDLWQIVKMWELNQEFGLEGMSQTIYGQQGEPRSWITNLPFHTAPNINKIPPGAPGIGNGLVGTFHYFSFMWYYSQLILNDSSKRPICTNPIDWGYFYGAVGDQAVLSAPQAGLLTAMLGKALQISNNGQGPQVGCVLGWNPTINDPSRLTAISLSKIWSAIPASTTSALVNAYVGAWYSTFRNFTPQQFYAGAWTSAGEPVTPGYGDGNMASRFADMIPRLKFMGLDPGIGNAITDWAAGAWPGYNWNIVRNATCTVPDSTTGYVRCSSDQ